MGIFGICAEAQQPVDQAIKDWGLHFQVCVPDCVWVFGERHWQILHMAEQSRPVVPNPAVPLHRADHLLLGVQNRSLIRVSSGTQKMVTVEW